MRYDSPANPPMYDFGFGAPPVSFGNYSFGTVGNTPQSMTMNGSIYAPEGSYLGAYALVMQQDAFRASLTANSRNLFSGTGANFSLANSHVDAFVPTLPAADNSGQTSGSTGAGQQTEGQDAGGKYTYTVDSNGNITYKRPNGTNCPVTEFRQHAGEDEFKKAQKASDAIKGQQS